MTQFEGNLTLGQYLRQQREKRGITIEQVASATKIGVRTLHALESDQYSELPAKPFIRGFVTSYSRFIGLDHKEVLTHFNSFIDSKIHERPNRESGHSGYVFEKREGTDQSRMILGIVMGSFIVLGGIALVVLKPSLHHHKHNNSDKLRAAHPSSSPVPEISPSAALPLVAVSPSVEVSPVPSASPSISPSPSEAPIAAPVPSATPSSTVAATPSVSQAAAPLPSPTASTADPLNSGLGLKPSETVHRLVIKATESVWVRYRVDDKNMMQFPLRKGRVLVLRARHNIVLQLGDPKVAEVSHNGQGYRAADTLSPVARQNDATLFFPAQDAEKITDPFPGQKPLSTRSLPVSPSPQPSPLST